MGYFHVDISSPHAGLEIASGESSKLTAVNLFGVNRGVSNAFETIWNSDGVYIYPTSLATLSCVSSSASDTMSVLISGLDDNYEEVFDVVELTGTTPVSTTNSFYRVNSAVILAGSNVGNITITHTGNTAAFIESTLGTTQSCVYTVPANKDLYIFRIDLTSGTVNNNQYLIYRNVTRSSTGRILRVAEASFAQNQQSFDRQIPFRVASKTDLQFEAKTSSVSNNEISIFIEAVLMEPED